MRTADLREPVALPAVRVGQPARGRVQIAVGSPSATAAGTNVLDLRLGRAALADGPLGPGALHAVAERLRGAYIRYISDRGREWDQASWWIGWLAERNPFVSQAFHLLTRLVAALEAIDRDPGLWQVVCDDPAMATALQDALAARGHAVVRQKRPATRVVAAGRLAAEFLARRLYFVAKWTRRILVARFAGARRQAALTAAIRSGQPLTIVQTWLDRRCYDEAAGTLTDFANFAGVKRWLRDGGQTVIAMPIVLRSVRYGKAVRSALARPEPTLMPEAYMAIGDVFRVALRSFAPRRRRVYPPLAGLPCGALFDRDDAREWIHHRRMENDLLDAMVARWRRNGFRVGGFLHTFEAHTWERVMGLALQREYPAARRIGFLGPALSRFRLNEFLTADEWMRAPLPHRVVTYGQLSTEHLQAVGCPADRLITGAAPWLKRLTGEPQDDVDRPERRAVLVVFSIDPIEGGELLDRVERAFEHERDLQVWLKFHPTLPFARVRVHRRLPPHFLVLERPIGEALLEVPVAIYGSTGASLEALTAGVVPVHVRLAGCLDQDPLEFWPELREVVDDPTALRDIVLHHMPRPAGDRAVRRARAHRVLREYFGQDDARFYEAFSP